MGVFLFIWLVPRHLRTGRDDISIYRWQGRELLSSAVWSGDCLGFFIFFCYLLGWVTREDQINYHVLGRCSMYLDGLGMTGRLLTTLVGGNSRLSVVWVPDV